MEQRVRYSDGIQSFEKIRTTGRLYVDKTELIYNLVTDHSSVFLSRPRRFGKSLMLSTMDAYFNGRRDLFQGLAIEHLEKDWTRYPVIHLDFNVGDYRTVAGLENLFSAFFKELESRFEIVLESCDVGNRFSESIRKIAEKEGRGVVVLVDEYDKPLIQNLDKPEVFEDMRELMRTFFSVLKTQDSNLRFSILTGVARFRNLSVFSGPNNLTDISMTREYSSICGITQTELETYFSIGIDALGMKLEKSRSEVIEILKEHYDGYCFYQNTPLLYNPYSLMQVFSTLQIENYWSYSGTPTILNILLKERNWDLEGLEHCECSDSLLKLPDTSFNNPIPILFQTGYLTIKRYDSEDKLYTLGYPNKEVAQSFINYLIPLYTAISDPNLEAIQIKRFLAKGNIKE